jgi:hypothetical protein
LTPRSGSIRQDNYVVVRANTEQLHALIAVLLAMKRDHA